MAGEKKSAVFSPSVQVDNLEEARDCSLEGVNSRLGSLDNQSLSLGPAWMAIRSMNLYGIS